MKKKLYIAYFIMIASMIAALVILVAEGLSK